MTQRAGARKATQTVAKPITRSQARGNRHSETEKRYRLLADNVTDVICTLDKNLVVTYLSPSVTHLLGYTVEQSLGQHWNKWIDESLAPESAKIATEVFREIGASMDDSSQDTYKSWTLELEFNRKDGSTLWTEGRVSILRSAEGKPIGFLAVVRDINERRRARVRSRNYY